MAQAIKRVSLHKILGFGTALYARAAQAEREKAFDVLREMFNLKTKIALAVEKFPSHS